MGERKLAHRQTCASQAKRGEGGDWARNKGGLNGSFPSAVSDTERQSVTQASQDRSHKRYSPTAVTETAEQHKCRYGPAMVNATGRQVLRKQKGSPRATGGEATQNTVTPTVMNSRYPVRLTNATIGTATPSARCHNRTAGTLAPSAGDHTRPRRMKENPSNVDDNVAKQTVTTDVQDRSPGHCPQDTVASIVKTQEPEHSSDMTNVICRQVRRGQKGRLFDETGNAARHDHTPAVRWGGHARCAASADIVGSSGCRHSNVAGMRAQSKQESSDSTEPGEKRAMGTTRQVRQAHRTAGEATHRRDTAVPVLREAAGTQQSHTPVLQDRKHRRGCSPDKNPNTPEIPEGWHRRMKIEDRNMRWKENFPEVADSAAQYRDSPTEPIVTTASTFGLSESYYIRSYCDCSPGTSEKASEKDEMVKKGSARTRSRSGQSEGQRQPDFANSTTTDTPDALETHGQETGDAASLLGDTPPERPEEAERNEGPEGTEELPLEKGEGRERRGERGEGSGSRDVEAGRQGDTQDPDGDSEAGSISAESADSQGRVGEEKERRIYWKEVEKKMQRGCSESLENAHKARAAIYDKQLRELGDIVDLTSSDGEEEGQEADSRRERRKEREKGMSAKRAQKERLYREYLESKRNITLDRRVVWEMRRKLEEQWERNKQAKLIAK